MAEFLQYLWEMLFDWPLGTVLVILIIVLVLLVAFLIIVLIINGIDYLTGTSTTDICTVVDKTYTEEHTRFIMVGKVMVPQYVDDSWELTLECDGAQGTASVSHEYFDKVRIGSKVRADFVRGGLIGSLHIQQIY